MSIRPVDFNGMIQRTQDVSTLKQNEDNNVFLEKAKEMGVMKRKNGRKKTRSSKRLTMFI